jgi:hypothetical protein
MQPGIEYTIKILAPDRQEICRDYSCDSIGTWRFVIMDDQNHYVLDYKNICRIHLILVYTEFILNNDM